MRKGFVLLAFVGVICGCATVKQMQTPDGKEAYLINCSGSLYNWSTCHEKANEICGEKGYIVLEESRYGDALISGHSSGLLDGYVINRNLIIQCEDE